MHALRRGASVIRPVLLSALRPTLLGIAIVLSGAHGACAQRFSATFDAGAAAVRYADSLDVEAATFTPAFAFSTASTSLSADGTFAQGGGGVWSLQGRFAGSAFTPSLGRVRAALAGSAGGSAHEDGTRTGELLARVRLHLMERAWGVWAGGGGGRTWDGDVWRDMFVGDAGIWLRTTATTIVLSAAPAVVDDTIRYTDAELSARWATSRLELSGVAGARTGSGLPTVAGSKRAWASVSATLWLRDRLALVAGGGSYPVDFTQGYPGGRFIQAGLRMAIGGSARTANASGKSGSDTHRTAPSDRSSAASRIASFGVEPGGGDEITLRVSAPDAHTVEVSGDFTNWEAIPLERDSRGQWTVTLPITPGTHQLNVRLDRSAWVVPPGLMTITDESGTSGLLVITR
jgi:hypothetical protein